MNKKLQNIFDFIQQSEKLDAGQKEKLLKAVKDADKELEIISFKLDRTEKVKKTTAILLEETIEELEQKRKSVEDQNRELEIESSLERVRTVAMSMNKSDDLISICEVSFKEFKKLSFDQLRNALIHIPNDEQKYFMDYDYSDTTGGSITKIKYGSHPIVDEYLKKIRSAEDAYFEVVIPVDQLKEWKDFRNKSGQKDDPRLDEATALYYYLFSIGIGDIGISALKPIDDSQIKILKRFRNVFDLTYRRYKDIAQAEAQARESEIELALERVRARTMAMQSSHELKEVVENLFDGLKSLGVDPTVCNISLMDEKTCDFDVWSAHQTNNGLKTYRVFISHFEHPFRKKLVDSFLNKILFSVHELSGDLKKSYIHQLIENVDYSKVPDEIRKSNKKLVNKEEGIVLSAAYMKYGLLIVSRNLAISKDESDILQRFAKIFEQTYTRFLDLQKAEAQAREAQIELALERVRARTMAMQKSKELKEVIQLVYEQFVHLKINVDHAGFVVDYTPKGDWHFWIADEQDIPSKITHPYFESVWANQFNEAKEKGADFFATNLNFEEKNKFYSELLSYVPGLPEASKDFYLSCPGLAISTVLLDNVCLYIENFSGIPYSDEENKILMRFGKVFQQTYTRFFDLKKAEAQTREAQIEAALERVRSKTMAMHNSQDVGATVVTLFDEVLKLGLDKSIRVGIGILEGNEGMETWSATSTPDGKVDLKMGMLDMTIHPMLIGLKKAWKSGKAGYSYDFIGDDVFRYYEALNNEPDYPFQADLNLLPKNEYHKSFFYTEGILFSFAPKPISDEAAKVLDRFAGVFGQTYRRYLDLKKAEEQAREAQIEAALERVRSQAMAMHSSEDLGMTVDTFFAELKNLNVSPHRCGVGIVNRETRIVRVQAVDTNQNNETKKIVGDLKLAGHPVLDKIFESWVKQEEYYPVLRGKEILEYYKVMNPQVKFNEFANDEVQYGYYFQFKEGGVYAWTDNKLQEQEIEIFRRYTSVLSLTYRRYLELKDAEARAIESVRQASLDRVRAEIASMRTSEDLNHITPIIWRELKNLEVPFFRCGLYIVDEISEKVKLYLTTPDGKSLGVLNLSFDSNKITSNTVDHWRKKIVYKTHWDREEFIEWTRSMMELGQIQSAETYQGSTTPPESLYLHFVPFRQGMLYVGDVQPLTDEKLELVKTLAEAFSIAYARYEDFNNLEEAKNKIEITLNELKAAQAQLIHSEKMASLGELTAGIAHEIKNPLNFVNNFSEVSRELLDEMQIEIKNNNIEDVVELVEDLKQNLDKINQHGKRADSIVRGMLLHSRGTSGEKVLTDLNDLLDQYVNLAYHGMRAQNKEFNITIEKDYDKSLEKINVVPQDISRVFLNIINNACYAAYDKKKKSIDNNFSPTLKVSTKNLNGNVEIRISDNGNGIPKDILDKIFQPFFTTKPTGEGTGLGLSLSYDVVTKVHNGNITFSSEDGKYTEFIITLPKS